MSTADGPVADGYQLKLIDPYNNPTLYVRRPGSDTQEVLTFRDDDPFLAEISSFIDTYELGKSDIPILSSYDDGKPRSPVRADFNS